MDAVPPEHAWVEDKDADRSLELTQSTIPNTVSTDDPVIQDQMTQAAAAVAVAKKVLSADKAKAEALINKVTVPAKTVEQGGSGVGWCVVRVACLPLCSRVA